MLLDELSSNFFCGLSFICISVITIFFISYCISFSSRFLIKLHLLLDDLSLNFICGFPLNCISVITRFFICSWISFASRFPTFRFPYCSVSYTGTTVDQLQKIQNVLLFLVLGNLLFTLVVSVNSSRSSMFFASHGTQRVCFSF